MDQPIIFPSGLTIAAGKKLESDVLIAHRDFQVATGISSINVDDEDFLRLKDAKAGLIWERNFWALTFQIHGQHLAALMRSLKFYTMHPDDPKLTVRTSYNRKNNCAPDRYYKGWGQMRDMRLM